jgi:predicted DNA binding CopG/RHH family protein
MVININHYAYLVPYIENDKEIFLKTIIRAEKQQRNTSEKNMKTKLTEEELAILKSFEEEEWTPAADFPERKKVLMEYARNTLKKDRRLNIRISERDLVELQRKAMEEGLPYQTYVASIIHKFINGMLVESRK